MVFGLPQDMRGGFFRKNLVIGAAEILCRLPLIFTLGFLARSVGPDAYGAWALLVVVQSWAASFGSLGLTSSLSRFSPVAEPALAHAYLRLAMRYGALAMAAIVVVGFLFQAHLGAALGIPPRFRWLVPVALLMATGSVVDGYLDAYFKARERLRHQIVFLLTRTAAEIIAVKAVFAGGSFADSGEALAAYVTVVLAVKLAVYPWLLREKAPDIKVLPQAERSAFIHYGYAMLPTLLLVGAISQVDRLVLGHLTSPAELGLYAFSATLASYLVFLGYAVMALFLPRASRLHDEGRHEELQRLFARTQSVFLGIMTAAMVPVALFPRDILLATAGAAFSEVPTTLVVLCLAGCIDQLLGVHQYVFHLVKKPGWIFGVYLLQGVLVVLLVSVFTLAGGASWAPWGVLMAVVLTNLVRYRLAVRMLNLRLPSSVAVGLPLTVVMLGILTLLATGMSLANRLWVGVALLFCLALFALKWRKYRPR